MERDGRNGRAFSVFAKVPPLPRGGNVHAKRLVSPPVALADFRQGYFPPPAPLGCGGFALWEMADDVQGRIGDQYLSASSVASFPGVSLIGSAAYARNREQYDWVPRRKGQILGGLALSNEFRALKLMADGLAQMEPPTTAQRVSALAQSVTQLNKLAADLLPDNQGEHVDRPSSRDITADLALLEAESGRAGNGGGEG